MKREDLPTVEELENYKVKLKDRLTKDGIPETTMSGWPDLYPGEFTTGRQLWYRFVRWTIGTPGKVRKRVKGYGWMLMLAIAIFIAIIVGAAANPEGSVWMFLSYFTFGIPSFIFWYWFVRRNHYFGAVQEVKAGERIPVAYEKDETGKLAFRWETATEDYTNIYRIPEESMDFILAFGVLENRAQNNTYTWIIKSHYHNLVWGPLLYADLDTAELSVLSPQVSIYPESIERALHSLRKNMEKLEMPDEDKEYWRELVTRMYAATSMLEDDEKELMEVFGKRLIKVKFTKRTKAFFLAWQNIVKEAEKEKVAYINAHRKEKREMITSINNARATELEKNMVRLLAKQIHDAAYNQGFTDSESRFMAALGTADEHIQAERAPVVREANDYVEKTFDKAYKEKLEKEIIGDGGSENQ